MNGYLNFLNLPNAVRLFQTTCNLFRSVVSDTVVDNDTLPLFTQGFNCFASRFGIFRIDQDDRAAAQLAGKRPIKLRKSKLNPVAGRARLKYSPNPS